MDYDCKKLTKSFLMVLGLILFSVHVSAKIKLTKDEIQWIKENPVVKFTGDPNWLPYEAFDENGNYIGIVAEHLKIISEQSGLKFKMSPSNTWTESVNKAKSKLVDVLSETDDSDLKSHLKFTNPYISNPIVIVMRNTEHYVEGISALKDKKIALIKDYGYASKIRRKYHDIRFETVENIQDGLISVSTGKVDTLLCTLALCSYTISELGLNNVKITGKSEFDTKLALGVQKNLPTLHSILNKAIKEITREQKQTILDSWIKNKFEKRTDYSLAIKTSAVLFVFILVFVFWNRRLVNEINLRVKAEEENKNKERTLRSQSEIIHSINSSMPGVVYQFKIDVDGNRSFPYMSSQIEVYLGITPQIFMDDAENIFKLVHFDDLPGLELSIKNSLENMSQWNWDGRLISTSNEIHWFRGSSIPSKK